MHKEGLLVVISAPSGTGKGTLLKLLEKVNPNIRFSTSATTRQPREKEVNGHHYFFVDKERFKKMIDEGGLVEWVEYCGNYYGTPKKYIENNLQSGYDVVLEIEVEGAARIKGKYPGSVSIFVLPPSFDELRSRITQRGTENPEVIDKRIRQAKEEIKYIDRYDYLVVNDTVEKAASSINSILAAEKLRYKRNKDILRQLGMAE